MKPKSCFLCCHSDSPWEIFVWSHNVIIGLNCHVFWSLLESYCAVPLAQSKQFGELRFCLSYSKKHLKPTIHCYDFQKTTHTQTYEHTYTFDGGQEFYSSCRDFVHRLRLCVWCVPFELEPIVSCEFLAFVLRGNKDRYYGTDTLLSQIL